MDASPDLIFIAAGYGAPMTNSTLEVSHAISEGEFLPYFQPLVELRTGKLRGFELLARWHHPQNGWIPPDEFIPIAERDGWIDDLTAQLLQKALPILASLSPTLKLAINISPLQLHNRRLPGQIESLANAAGFSLNRLVIEITESALADDREQAGYIANELKEMGCGLALDDFGTGYSSLLHLQSLPFDELKVDRSFVSSMTEQRDSRKIVAAVVGLGQSLGMTTVAEGVETQEQAEMLLWLGTELGQGWLFGKPVPAEDLMAIVSNPRPNLPSTLSPALTGRVSSRSLESLPAQRLAQLRAVYDGAPVGLTFLDRDLRYMNVNRRLADMNGRPMEEHLGRTVQEMIPDLFPRVEPFIRRALNGESISGVEITNPSSKPNPGQTILVSYEPTRDAAGEVIGVSVAVMDVTRQKRAEAAFREVEENFRNMMELSPQIPWVIDPQGGALDVSRRWLDITGMTGDEWKGMGWLNALHPDDRQPTLDAIHHATATMELIDTEYRVSRPGHGWQWVRARGAPRVDENGTVLSWYGCLDELDDRN